MRVLPDAERRFRVEGIFELALNESAAAGVGYSDSERRRLEVAGGRNARYCRLPVALPLPVVGWVAARAA